MEILNNKPIVQCFIKQSQAFDPEQLLDMASYSPCVQVGNPLKFIYQNNQLFAEVEAYYDNLQIRKLLGKTLVQYPGKNFKGNSKKELARALFISLIRGDADVIIN